MNTETPATTELAPDTAQPEGENPVESPDAQPDSDEATGPADPNNRRDRRAERRISRLTARNAALTEGNENLKSRLDKLEEKFNASVKPARPQADNFETTEDYEDALIDYRLEQQKPTSPAPNKDEERRFSAFMAEAGKTHEGFDNLVATAQFPLTEHSFGELMDMGEDGADLFIHLNEHPAEAMRISQLSPREQTKELDKLSDTMGNTSRAPEPIKPVTGNDSGAVDESKLSDAEWITRRNKKVHGG